VASAGTRSSSGTDSADVGAASADAEPAAEAPGAEAAGTAAAEPAGTEATGKPAADTAAPNSDEIESGVREKHASYHLTVHGGVHADKFVAGSALRRDYRTGPVDDQELREVLRFFHPPVCFDDARVQIATAGFLVLCGAEGSGRRCAALELLHGPHCPGADNRRAIELLEPVTTLDSLLDRPFAPGGRYLLADFRPGGDDGQLQFEAGQLRRRVSTARAFLIVTTDSPPGPFGADAVPCQPPSAAEAFAAHRVELGAGWTDEQESLAERVVSFMRLDRLARFIDDIAQHGLEAACAPFGDDARSNLRAWLDKKPSVPEVAPIVVAALLPAAVEREHESRAVALAAAIDTRADRNRADADYRDDLHPSRAGRGDRVVRGPDPLRMGGHVVTLAAALTAEIVLTELHDRYGDELWVPVREWLYEQPSGGDVRVTTSLAAGLAGLARVDRGLTDGVLSRWARDHDDNRRWAAAVAVAGMCGDEHTAGRALATARAWARGAQQQKITAAHAFCLDLSDHRPAEAISTLWNLTLGDAIVAIYARAELMALARRATVTDGLLRRLVAVVAHQLHHLVESVPSGDPLIGRALATVARILPVRSPDGTPLTMCALDADPDLAPLLGQLWAAMLRSWKHRVTALDELYPVLAHPDTPATAVLGTALRADLGPAEWRWLCRDIGIDIRTARETVEAV
jgi:hypothetical protein